MRVVVTGSEGQLGSALKLTCPADIEPVWLGHKDLDITDEAAVARHPAFEGADAIINTAGYTNVDAAETPTLPRTPPRCTGRANVPVNVWCSTRGPTV